MITALVWIVIVCAVAWLAYYVISQFPPPEPINRVARVVIVVIAVLLIIGIAASLFGVNTGLPNPSG